MEVHAALKNPTTNNPNDILYSKLKRLVPELKNKLRTDCTSLHAGAKAADNRLNSIESFNSKHATKTKLN